MIPTGSPRAGLGFIKFLMLLVALAVLAALAWGVYANWSRDRDGDGKGDGFSLDVTDPDWLATSKDKAQPWIDYSFEKAAAAKDAVWGDGGLIDDTEAWLREREAQQPASPPPAVPPPATGLAPTSPTGPVAAPAKPVKTPATLRQEEQFRTAAELMQEGLVHYRAGVPANNGWTDASVKSLNEAQRCFTRVRDLLGEENLSRYAAAPDHDPRLLTDARAMQGKNQHLLHSVQKMGSSM